MQKQRDVETHGKKSGCCQAGLDVWHIGEQQREKRVVFRGEKTGESQRKKKHRGHLRNQQESANTSKNMLTFSNILLVLHLDSFGFGVRHIQYETHTLVTQIAHAHTQTTAAYRQTHTYLMH